MELFKPEDFEYDEDEYRAMGCPQDWISMKANRILNEWLENDKRNTEFLKSGIKEALRIFSFHGNLAGKYSPNEYGAEINSWRCKYGTV